MDVSIENTGGLERRMTVQVPAERVDQEVQSRLQSMARTIKIDGFRPGKVPVKVIEQKYGGQVRLEVVEQVLRSTMQEALTQENLRPTAEPQIEKKDADAGEPLEYVATFEVFPEFEAGLDYAITINKPVASVTDSDIDNMLETLRRQRATWDEVDRSAAMNDQILIDFEGSVDGNPFTGNKGEKMPVILGSNSMIPGFEEQLVGVSAGDDKVVKVTFPEDYPSSEVAGKDAKFDIKVHTVSEMKLPELNDEFASAFGVGDKGLDGLKEEVSNNMQRELDGLVLNRIKQDAFTALLEKNPVEIPKSMLDHEIEALKTQDDRQGMDTSALEAEAEKRVKLGILISEVVKQNQIDVDTDRVRQTVEKIAASYEKPEEVVQWYYGNQDMLSGVQTAVLENQVVDWLIESSGATVVEQEMTFNDLVDAARQPKGQD